MTRQLKRRSRPTAVPHRQLKRRSKPDWPYTFDYDDENFLKYFRSVTGIQIGKEEKPDLARFLIVNPKADHWLRTSNDFKYLTGIMVPFKYREDSIRMNQIIRDRLQKEWNNYQKTKVRKIKRYCKCGCGNISKHGKYIWGHHARTNNPNYKHGLKHHKLYTTWQNMKQRCYNPNAKQYKDYGGRGIRVCIRWRRSVKSFYNWAIANGWKEDLTINRIDNDGNYTPDNCNFVTRPENNSNKRVYITKHSF